MKRKFRLTWRMGLTLFMALSLLMFAAPAAAVLPAGLSVDVDAYCKDGNGVLHPYGSGECACIEPGDQFYVNAAVTAIDVDVDDVAATITIVSGAAILQPVESATKVLGNIQSCRLGDVWWKLLCTGPGMVTIQVDVEGDGGTITDSDTRTISQCTEACEPCLSSHWIEPDKSPYDVEVCQTFGVKVWYDADCDVTGLSATISITDDSASSPSGTPSDAAVLVEGMPPTFYLSDLEAGDGAEVGWTLHCESPEDVKVWVTFDHDNAKCEEPIHRIIHQKAPACLYIDWATPENNEQICAGCEIPFMLAPTIKNPCDYDAEYVIANLTWTNPSSVDVSFPYTRSIDLVEADGSWTPTPWEVECLEEGTVVFTLEVRGYDTKTGAEIVVTTNNTRTINQVDFMIDITTPETCETFSTEQSFCVSVDLKNCSGDDLTDIPVTISVDPATGATLSTTGCNPNGCPTSWTQLVDLCDCCECSLNWCLECAEPNEDMVITITVDLGGGETYTDTVTVHQELKAHLVAGLQSYYQCDPDHLLTPMTAYTPGQEFHIVVPVYNTGEATAENVTVKVTYDAAFATLVDGGEFQDIGDIPGGGAAKATWVFLCEGEGDLAFSIEGTGDGYGLVGSDENTELPVLEANYCLPCPLEIKQIPVELTWIQWPEECIEPCTDFTLKAMVQNWDFDDDLNGVSATLYWNELSGPGSDSVEFADGQLPTVPLENLICQEDWKGKVECGTASDTSTDSTLADSGTPSWPGDKWVGYAVEIKAGTGAGQIRKITDNTGDTLSIEPNWTAPDATSEYCIIEGEWAEATWQMHCKDIGDVEFYYVVSVADPLMCITSDTKYVCQEVPTTCLEIDITSPDMGSFYATGQEFAITAEIRNRGIQIEGKDFPIYWPEEAWNVVTGLNDFGYEGDDPHGFRDGLGHFTIVDCNFEAAEDDYGMPLYEDGMPLYDIGNIPAGESAMVTWTVRCDRSGLTAVVAEVDWDNKDVECVHPGLEYEDPRWEWVFTALQYKFDVHDFLLLWQYPASHLEVEILTVMPGTTVNVSDEFIVTYIVKNTGEADASQVEAILSVTPEGSARPVAGLDSGYTQYIGTIPGYGETEPLTWPLHCKEVSESTINITAEGLDEYGWHKKQQCANTGNFFIEGGCLVAEGLLEQVGGPAQGWTYGVFVGDANGLLGPFSVDTPVAWSGLDGVTASGELVVQGYVIPHVGTFGGWAIEDLCGDCCNLLDILGDVEGEDLMIFVGYWTGDESMWTGEFMQEMCVVGGLLEVINGTITGGEVQYCSGGDCDAETPFTEVMSFLGGEYCSSMAAEAGLPIDPRFIEDAWVTVKQLPATADLEVTKVVDPTEPVVVGSEVTFTVTVENLGPSDATGIMVYDILSKGLNFTGSTPSQGWYYVGEGMWSVGDLAEGDFATLTITATVNAVGEVYNSAVIGYFDQHDPDTGNDADYAVVTGLEPPPFTVWCQTLNEGYNLISLTLIPDVINIEQMLITLNSLDLRVASYFTGGPGGDWLSFWPGDPGATELLIIEDGKGYWLDLNSAVSPNHDLCYDGSELVGPPPAVPPSYDVVEGWNLIGFKSTRPKPVEEYLLGIEYFVVYGFADGAYFIAGSPGHEMLQPGLGYWLAAKPGTIYP